MTIQCPDCGEPLASSPEQHACAGRASVRAHEANALLAKRETTFVAESLVHLQTLQSTVIAEGPPLPSLLLKTIVTRGERTTEGHLIEAVTLPWFEIIAILIKDPSAAFDIPPDKWEEIIAGSYKQAGFEEVTLTPRSGDFGRDVIAVKRGVGTIRVIDQVKAYGPAHRVNADHVRALLGVLQTEGASKGFLTTTSSFAPRIREDPFIAPLIPSRLELIDGERLLAGLTELASRKDSSL
jgi:restriction system protein